jgi:hypothetical protein
VGGPGGRSLARHATDADRAVPADGRGGGPQQPPRPGQREHNISTSTPTSNLDTVLGVYDSAGNRLAYNDDGGFSGDPLDSNLNVTLIAGVRYYFGVTNYINNTTPGAYSWFVRAPK